MRHWRRPATCPPSLLSAKGVPVSERTPRQMGRGASAARCKRVAIVTISIHCPKANHFRMYSLRDELAVLTIAYGFFSPRVSISLAIDLDGARSGSKQTSGIGASQYRLEPGRGEKNRTRGEILQPVEKPAHGALVIRVRNKADEILVAALGIHPECPLVQFHRGSVVQRPLSDRQRPRTNNLSLFRRARFLGRARSKREPARTHGDGPNYQQQDGRRLPHFINEPGLHNALDQCVAHRRERGRPGRTSSSHALTAATNAAADSRRRMHRPARPPTTSPCGRQVVPAAGRGGAPGETGLFPRANPVPGLPPRGSGCPGGALSNPFTHGALRPISVLPSSPAPARHRGRAEQIKWPVRRR